MPHSFLLFSSQETQATSRKVCCAHTVLLRSRCCTNRKMSVKRCLCETTPFWCLQHVSQNTEIAEWGRGHQQYAQACLMRTRQDTLANHSPSSDNLDFHLLLMFKAQDARVPRHPP